MTATTTSRDATSLAAAVAGFETLPSAAERRLAERLALEVTAGPESVRARSAARLVELAGERAAAPLIEALATGEVPVQLRVALIRQLGRTGGVGAIEILREHQLDDDAAVRAAAVDALVGVAADEPEALEAALAAAISDPDARVRRRAALAAASARGLDPGLMLAPLLRDPDRQARRLAAIALGSTRDPAAVKALIDALLDEDEAVRSAAELSARSILGKEAAGIAALPAMQRGRAAARLRAHLAANLSKLAPDGVLRALADVERSEAARRPSSERRSLVALVTDDVLDELFGADDDDGWDSSVASASFRRYLASEIEEEDRALDDASAEVADAFGERDDEARALLDRRIDAEAPILADAIDDDGDVDFTGADGAARVASEEEAGSEAAPRAEPMEEEGGRAVESPEPHFRAIEEILRASLRGVEDEALARELGFSPLAFGPVLEEHVQAGRIVRRGRKLYLP